RWRARASPAAAQSRFDAVAAQVPPGARDRLQRAGPRRARADEFARRRRIVRAGAERLQGVVLRRRVADARSARRGGPAGAVRDEPVVPAAAPANAGRLRRDARNAAVPLQRTGAPLVRPEGALPALQRGERRVPAVQTPEHERAVAADRLRPARALLPALADGAPAAGIRRKAKGRPHG